MDEQKTNEADEKERTDANLKEGFQSETNKEIERIRSETERLNLAIAEKEKADARAKLAGISSGINAPAPIETPREFVEKVLGTKKIL